MGFFFEKYYLTLSAETTKKVEIFTNWKWRKSTHFLKYIGTDKDGLVTVYKVEIF